MRYCQATLREGSLDRLLIVVLYSTRRDTVSFVGAPMSDSGSSLGMIFSLFCLSAVSTSLSGGLALSSGTSVFVGSTSWMPVVCGVDRQAPKKNGNQGRRPG